MSSPPPKAPSPDASLVELDQRQLGLLRRVGREWGRVCGNPEVWRRALPVDPTAASYPARAEIRPTRFGRFVPVQSTSPPEVQATQEAHTFTGGIALVRTEPTESWMDPRSSY